MRYLLLFILLIQSCKFLEPKLGSKEKPLHLIISNATGLENEDLDFDDFLNFMEEKSNLFIKIKSINVHQDLPSLFKTEGTHIGLISSNLFVSNMDNMPVKVKLTIMRYGKEWYRSEIITHTNSGIEKIEDLNGKSFAFVNQESSSGYLIPKALLLKNKIKLKDHAFVGGHSLVPKLIYQRQFDAGATFYDDSNKESITDGRLLIQEEFPDVAEKIKIIHISGKIPYEPIIFHNDLKPEIVADFTNGLRRYLRRFYKKNAFYKYFKIESVKSSDNNAYVKFKTLLKK
jgi:phosphonate transport system substrate-binding protein